MQIEKISIYRLRIPLTSPYKLAFGEIHAFDTILVEAYNQDGTLGLGEATLLTGYTDENIKDSWGLASRLAPQIVGSEFQDAKQEVEQLQSIAPFTVTAFVTALEMIEKHPLLQVSKSCQVPILGLVHGNSAAALSTDIESQLDKGYSTLKVKVGFDAKEDLQRIRLIQDILRNRALIRLDANQGYSREDAKWFATHLAPDGIELFEQPCAAGDWEGACEVARVSNVPMMLDESILDLDDIARAAEMKAAAFIKLKLMKMGGLTRLAQGLDFIRKCGMEPVLGNGVASDVGCWMEACVARNYITNAGEMNGFLKPHSSMLDSAPAVRQGAIVVEPGFEPSLNRAAIARHAQQNATFSA